MFIVVSIVRGTVYPTTVSNTTRVPNKNRFGTVSSNTARTQGREIFFHYTYTATSTYSRRARGSAIFVRNVRTNNVYAKRVFPYKCRRQKSKKKKKPPYGVDIGALGRRSRTFSMVDFGTPAVTAEKTNGHRCRRTHFIVGVGGL